MWWYWLALLGASACEAIMIGFIKSSEGLTKLRPSVWAVVFGNIGLVLLMYAVKKIPATVAYPIWTGIGGVSVILVSILFFKESHPPLKVVLIVTVIAGLAGLACYEK